MSTIEVVSWLIVGFQLAITIYVVVAYRDLCKTRKRQVELLDNLNAEIKKYKEHMEATRKAYERIYNKVVAQVGDGNE